MEQGNHITVQWIPGHVGLDGNEEVDKLAKGATMLYQKGEPINLEEVKSVLKKKNEKQQYQ